MNVQNITSIAVAMACVACASTQPTGETATTLGCRAKFPQLKNTVTQKVSTSDNGVDVAAAIVAAAEADLATVSSQLPGSGEISVNVESKFKRTLTETVFTSTEVDPGFFQDEVVWDKAYCAVNELLFLEGITDSQFNTILQENLNLIKVKTAYLEKKNSLLPQSDS